MPKQLNISLTKRLELAGKIDFFSTLKEHQRITVLKQLESNVFLYDVGEIIIEEGAVDTALYIILSGRVVVKKGIDEIAAVGVVSSGDFFGEISFMMDSKRMATVVAQEECIVLQLSKERFNTLEMAVQLDLKDKVLKELISRLDTMNKTVLKLQTKTDV